MLVLASLVPLTNGLCTLTQRFEGSGNDIVWEGAGVSFVGGGNRGSEVTVVGGSVGSYMLTVGVNGLPLVPGPFFFGKVMTPTTAPVTVWIVQNDTGGDAPITQSQIQPLFDDVNKILKQKALTLNWSGTANYTNRTEWLDITDAMNPTNAVLDALLDCSKNTGGVLSCPRNGRHANFP